MSEQTIPAVDMYPSLIELLDSYTTIPIPEDLRTDLYRRYNAHGMEYASDIKHLDDRIINRCMLKDSVQDAREELTDAIFNLLVACLKQNKGVLERGVHSWRPRVALGYVVRAWATITP